MTYYLTPQLSVGEEKDTATGLGLDVCHVSNVKFFKFCLHLCLWLVNFIKWLVV